MSNPTFVKYKNVVIEGPMPYGEPAQFAKLEQELGCTLPTGFKEFLAAAHGGRLQYIFDAPEGDSLSSMDIFPLQPDKRKFSLGETIFTELRQAVLIYELPQQVLPFAMGGGDIPVFLDLTLEGNGRVVVFFYGVPEWAGQCQENAFVEVAASFEAFLSKLRLDEADCIECLSNALGNDDGEAVGYNAAFLDVALPDWRMKYRELAQRCP